MLHSVFHKQVLGTRTFGKNVHRMVFMYGNRSENTQIFVFKPILTCIFRCHDENHRPNVHYLFRARTRHLATAGSGALPSQWAVTVYSSFGLVLVVVAAHMFEAKNISSGGWRNFSLQVLCICVCEGFAKFSFVHPPI